MRTNHFVTSDLPLVIGLSLVALFLSTSPALSQVTDNPAVNETVNETVNQNLNPLNGAINQGNSVVDDINGGLDNAPTEANSAINRTIDSVLDQEAQSEIGGAIGTVQQAGGLISRVIGLGDRIKGILGSFDLEQILDAANIELSKITGNIYGGSNANTGDSAASDPLADIEAGALGLPGIDEVDQAIDSEGGTALMESLAGKQEGGGMSSQVYLENLFRKDQAEQIADKTALGRVGQQKLANNAIAADDALKTSTAMMEDSEKQDVSQNVLRNISVQAQAQTIHTGLLALDAQLRARDDSVRNVLLARTLMEAQGERVSEQRRNASAYSAIITSGGLFYLPGLGDEKKTDDEQKAETSIK
jgi:hypothetical protein